MKQDAQTVKYAAVGVFFELKEYQKLVKPFNIIGLIYVISE